MLSITSTHFYLRLIITATLLLLIFQNLNAQPQDVLLVLKKAGKNRTELEKAINYFKKTGDPLKLKAIYFLIANMDIHQSENYYWADASGNKIAYNELAYPSFEKAIQAFEAIKNKNPGIHPVRFSAKDEQHIKANYLIHNTESAFKAWRASVAKNIPFKDFCEYILPYRASVEPLQNWRTPYQQKFNWLPPLLKKEGVKGSLQYVAADYKLWFKNTFSEIRRKEPLPRLGALQLLSRKEGPCEDIASLEVFTLRSNGLPVALDIIPYWATSANSHFINSVFDLKMKPIHFDVSRTNAPVNTKLLREPAKVIRLTYSKQAGTLAGLVNKKYIPDNFLRTQNYIDVTTEYWETNNITCKIAFLNNKVKVAYACVFNGMRWKPSWWSMLKGNDVTFSAMPKGAVYLPAFYIDGQIKPAGYPVINGYDKITVLKPELTSTRTVIINQQEGYLIFRPGKSYKLYYWDNSWKLINKQTVTPFSKALLFNKVPKNALLMLLPEYSEGKERPFIISDNGERQWF